MRALTVKPPWSHAIAKGTKRVENRSWPAPAFALRTVIAIHAGKGFDWGAQFPPGLTIEWAAPEDCSLGAVVAVARLADCHPSAECMDLPPHVAGPGQWEGCSPWAIRGEYHWQLVHVQALPEPVPCRGALGLWRLPEDVEKAIREQLSEPASPPGA